jgi:hypothetical protein
VTNESLQIFLSQKGKKTPGTRGPSRFGPLGNEDAYGNQEAFFNTAKLNDTTTTIPLCESYDNPLNADSTVLNADIVIEVANSKFGSFAGRCDDDPLTYCYYIDDYGNEVQYYCEEKDESIVNIPAGVCE